MNFSDGYHYGSNNLTAYIKIKNNGNVSAFNILLDILNNQSSGISEQYYFISPNELLAYDLNFTNISDFEFSAVADINNIVEETDETNNAETRIIKINKRPLLTPVNNITINSSQKIILNLTAYDSNNDTLTYQINSTKFLKIENSLFEWNTAKNDVGNYTFSARVSDGYLNDSSEFNVEILNAENYFSYTLNDTYKFYIKNKLGEIIAWFGNAGNIIISGILEQKSNYKGSYNDSFTIKNRNEPVLMLADNGSLYIDGALFYNYNFSNYKFGFNDFMMRDAFGNIAVAVNESGSLFLKGDLIENGSPK